ncbi:MAG: trehalose-6-phosphate synthase, partial [Paraburkholderia tropica]
MSRLIIVSNRVAPISEGGPAAGGLAVGVYDALKETGGMWFGWSGDVLSSGQPGIQLEERGPVTFATIGLLRRDYDQYYRGFSNATLWPAFHYRADLVQYDRHDYEGYCRVNAWLAQQLVPLLHEDDVIWVHDYHLIP